MVDPDYAPLLPDWVIRVWASVQLNTATGGCVAQRAQLTVYQPNNLCTSPSQIQPRLSTRLLHHHKRD